MKDEEIMLKHELVPKHEILDESETKKVLESFNITKDQLPQILDDDPVVVALGAKPGDVLKIIRNSQTAGKTEYFRAVISS